MLRFWLVCLLACLGLAASAQPSLTGQWLNEGQDARIEISETAAPFQGKLAWTSDKKGQDKLGTRILRDLSPAKSGWTGQVYSLKQDKTYPATFHLKEDGAALEMTVKAGFLSQTQTWRRVK